MLLLGHKCEHDGAWGQCLRFWELRVPSLPSAVPAGVVPLGTASVSVPSLWWRGFGSFPGSAAGGAPFCWCFPLSLIYTFDTTVPSVDSWPLQLSARRLSCFWPSLSGGGLDGGRARACIGLFLRSSRIAVLSTSGGVFCCIQGLGMVACPTSLCTMEAYQQVPLQRGLLPTQEQFRYLWQWHFAPARQLRLLPHLGYQPWSQLLPSFQEHLHHLKLRLRWLAP